MKRHLDSEFLQVSPRRRVVGAGFIALDVLLDEDKSTVSSSLGGSAGNVLAILAHLGWSSVPVAKVGVDLAAEQIRREFEELRADVRFLVSENHFCTPIVFQLPGNEVKSHRFSFSCPHCGRKRHFSYSTDDQLGAPVLSEVQKSDVYYFDRVTSLSLKLAEDYRRRGAFVMFEPSSIGNDIEAFEKAVNVAHVIKYADDRIADLQAFDLSNVAIEVQTLGKAGLKFRSPSSKNKWTCLPSYSTAHIEDTSGAGDWCTSGMLYSLFADAHRRSIDDLANADMNEALRFGQALAALNCSYAGARGMAQNQEANEIFDMATALQNSRSSYSTYFLGKKHQDDRRFSAEKNSSSTEKHDTYYGTKLCCDGLSL